jgi:hypothetical protein
MGTVSGSGPAERTRAKPLVRATSGISAPFMPTFERAACWADLSMSTILLLEVGSRVCVPFRGHGGGVGPRAILRGPAAQPAPDNRDRPGGHPRRRRCQRGVRSELILARTTQPVRRHVRARRRWLAVPSRLHLAAGSGALTPTEAGSRGALKSKVSYREEQPCRGRP